MVNQINYDWESTNVMLSTGIAIGITKIEYSDDKEVKEVYGHGSMPVAEGRGNYKGEGKMTLLRAEYLRLVVQAKLLKVKGFYGLPLSEVMVAYKPDLGPLTTDVLHQVRFKHRGFGIDQGAEKAEIELDFLILGGIESDGLPADSLF
jgi:hypothetical protein